VYGCLCFCRDGTLSICLEYMAGGSLQDVVQAGGCRDELVLAGLARQVLAGVAYLHSHRHIHRDIKPGNILIGGGSLVEGGAVVKISDFGISKELEEGHSLADSFLGTFHYMSP
jgi:serine/threonine protein kinase